jgi:Uma2 family endonuclease
MVQFDLKNLPTSDELPGSDETPVDNEDQNFLPNFLLFLLATLWKDRMDWFFSVDMGIYHTTGNNPRVPVIPDGFLSIGVERRKQGKSRKSYVVWEENNVVPIWVLEVVSDAYGGDYDEKLKIYQRLGVLYYVIYNPEFYQRHGHQPFEVYKLINGIYQLQSGEPIWMPEVGLGIGRFQRVIDGLEREVLYWYGENGDRYLTADEQLEQEQQEKEQLLKRLRTLGIDPTELA